MTNSTITASPDREAAGEWKQLPGQTASPILTRKFDLPDEILPQLFLLGGGRNHCAMAGQCTLRHQHVHADLHIQENIDGKEVAAHVSGDDLDLLLSGEQEERHDGDLQHDAQRPVPELRLCQWIQAEAQHSCGVEPERRAYPRNEEEIHERCMRPAQVQPEQLQILIAQQLQQMALTGSFEPQG